MMGKNHTVCAQIALSYSAFEREQCTPTKMNGGERESVMLKFSQTPSANVIDEALCVRSRIATTCGSRGQTLRWHCNLLWPDGEQSTISIQIPNSIHIVHICTELGIVMCACGCTTLWDLIGSGSADGDTVDWWVAIICAEYCGPTRHCQVYTARF